MQYLYETGVYQHMNNLEILQEEMVGRATELLRASHQYYENKQKAITLIDVCRGAFLLMSAGYLLAASIFINEILAGIGNRG